MNGPIPSPAAEEETPTIAGLKIEDVGVLPEVAVQITKLADQPTTTTDQIVRLIVLDATLTSKVLRILNSTFYGLCQEIRSLQHAVAYLGTRQIRNLVLSSTLIESFPFDHGVVEPRTVWEHSLGCAIGAKRVVETIPHLDGDDVYLGGLLHDLGRIFLIAKAPDRYASVVNTCERGLCSLREAEESVFGVGHEEVGFALGQAWGFSESTLAMIRHHHRPAEAGPMAFQSAAVSFANAICHQEGMRFGFEMDDENAAEELDRAWAVLQTGDRECAGLQRDAVEKTVVESIRHTAELLGDLL